MVDDYYAMSASTQHLVPQAPLADHHDIHALSFRFTCLLLLPSALLALLSCCRPWLYKY